MFFWLAVLTFFSTILIYGLYPRNDAIKIIDKPEANVAISEIVTLHTSALSALMVSKNHILKYTELVQSADPYTVVAADYARFLPYGYKFSSSVPPLAKVFCVDNETGALTYQCNVTFPQDDAPTRGTTDYLVTYGTISPADFSTYIAHLAKRSLGEKVFLTNYDEKYHLRVHCGTLSCSGSGSTRTNCRVDNTRFLTAPVPDVVARSIPADSLVCVSRLSVAYDLDSNNSPIYIPVHQN